LNRPDVLNAFDDQMTTDLQDALKQVERDEEVRCLIITGAGRAFSSGQDLADLKTKYTSGSVPDFGADLRRRYNPVIRRLRGMEKPVIAAVNGVAAGGGLGVALACDLRIASEKASFIEVFINVGLVGLGKALELCFTGDKVGAEEALSLGLVNKVVPPEELMKTTTELARKLATLPTRAIGLTKRLFNRAMSSDLEGQLEAEAFAQETAGKTDDHLEGVMAFIEKRKPQFTGK
jgi:2-(1,2-epoxy-1,2-dihydrophenyl)acetyl-CoA isomerase